MENLQSIIYQKQYQEALKAQLEGVLSNLQSNSYATVSDYLTKCYRDGYTGVMYDLQKTGIPIIMPIDQTAVVRAIQTDSKLSKSLYDKMGEDVTYLKKAVRAEVSRGIANGSTWNEVAGKLSRHMANTPFQKAYNNSIRIARTEGHRIQVQSALDAMYIAKSKGADVLKQWDATLDGATREHHQMLDGQIREVDEPFEVGGRKIKAPGMFGDPAEDCNCRCCLLQRARWALDDEELETLRERAEYFGLDKTKDFEEYQTKYFKVSCEIEHEKEQSKPKYIYKDTVIHKKIIESPDYRRKFNQISDSDRVNRIAWQRSKEMLTHRSGTRYEDIAFVDYMTGKSKINKEYHEESTAKPNKIPKVSISRIDELDAPQLAEGGVLKRGQVGILEGNGAEAVVPLEKNTGWIKKVAEDMADITGGAVTGDSESLKVLYKILEIIRHIDDNMYEWILTALTEGVRLKLDGREFGRMVRNA